MYEYSEIQQQLVNKLESLKFRVNHHSQTQDEEFPTIYLSRKNPSIRFSTQYAEIDGDGLINGMTYENFIRSLN